MNLRLRDLLAALLLHLLLFTVLAVDLTCSRKIQPARIVQGVLLDPSRQKVADNQRRAAEAERQKQEQLQKREEEQRQEQQRQEQKKAEQQRQEKLKLEQRKQQEQADRKKKDEALKRQLDEQRRKRMQEEEQQAMHDQIRQQALQQESGAVQDAKLAQWMADIQNKVRRNWQRPPGTDDAFECQVRVEQLPGGQIVSRRLAKSCGNAALDDSVLRAVDKSDPLPMVPDPALFQRAITFTFSPQ